LQNVQQSRSGVLRLFVGGDARAPHEMLDLIARRSWQDLRGQQALNLLQGLVRPVREDQPEHPQADQQQGNKGQDKEECQAGSQQSAVVLAEPLEHAEDESDPEDSLQPHQYCVHGCPSENP